METTALYRKHRPDSFDNVIGQDHIVTALKAAIANKTIAHAYLFFGTRGIGKTSVARILARELGTSDNDIYEIDAASNRGIDDIRELRDSVHTRPFDSDYKIYIIDEVHMLTKDAFNALLKTLEEPPSHVIFILATTELHKVIDTVVSRCQLFTFKQPSQAILKDHLLDIVKKENYTIEPSAAELIALLGDGSFRDTLGVLQQIMSSVTDGKITMDHVESLTGAPRNELVHKLLVAFAERSIETGLAALEYAVTKNTDIETLIKLLIHNIRLILLLRFSKQSHARIKDELSPEDFTFLQNLTGIKGKRLNAKLLNQLLEVLIATKQSYIPQLPIEVLIVSMADTKHES